MSANKCGKQSFRPGRPVYLTHWASVAGKKEGQGPLASKFDQVAHDNLFSQPTWEQAEKRMQQLALETLEKKAAIRPKDIDVVFSGDLLNQCIGSSFSLRNTLIPHLGLYGACSTMAESLLLSAAMVGGSYVNQAVAMTSSHFAGSERQYRFPLGYGGQRTPTAQWTVTGSGAVLVSPKKSNILVTSATIGTVTDLGITDANNMGAAMAPAACATICAHFRDLKASPKDYDAVITGDLGGVGHSILGKLLEQEGFHLGDRLLDCGMMIFEENAQDVHAGGSGCGCSAVVLCALLLDKLKEGTWKKILFCGTGALLSPTSTQQKLPIPGVCHAVCLEHER